MPYTDINDPSAYFQTKLYTGNSGTGHAITNDGNSDLQPDLLWIKNRTVNYSHALYDSTRGTGKVLRPNGNNTETTVTNGVTAFGTNGFTVGSAADVNENALVAWQWKANAGSTSTDTSGDITSTVQVNQDAGFSIVTYTGNTSNNQTVGHGLGAKPSVILIRNRTRVEDWRLNHQSINNGTGMIRLNSTDAYNTTGTTLMNVAPTSSVFNVSTDFSVNGNYPFVAWCWAEKQGYSKFGKYIGNGSTNGTFIYTGFKPAFILLKKTSDSGDNWMMYDNKRPGLNVTDQALRPNSDAVEYDDANANIDILSNGFKLRSSFGWVNQNTHTYLYMAFAENPFTTSTGIPTTAR